jgi:hypothetical protein
MRQADKFALKWLAIGTVFYVIGLVAVADHLAR